MEQFEKILLGGGCFWCVEAIFQRVKGIAKVISGYSGGTLVNPTSQAAYRGNSGHAEVIEITFCPNEVSLREILNIFFHVHDPTTLNRQGADIGTLYRSVVFYFSEDQRKIIEEVILDIEMQKVWAGKIVTQVEPAQEFYPAESYHQDFYRTNSSQPYCTYVIDPKMAKFLKKFPDHVVK